jgi:phage gpG-like protein
MTITVSGIKELNVALRSLGINADKAINMGVEATAQQVRNTAIKSIQSVSAGETVQRSRQGGNGTYSHVASKAGEAPNTDTGRLVASVAIERPTLSSALVGTGLDYGLFLELGTSKMQPRPWLQPALDANIKQLPINVGKAIQRLLK